MSLAVLVSYFEQSYWSFANKWNEDTRLNSFLHYCKFISLEKELGLNYFPGLLHAAGDHRQISLLILCKMKQINQFLNPLKASENLSKTAQLICIFFLLYWGWFKILFFFKNPLNQMFLESVTKYDAWLKSIDLGKSFYRIHKVYYIF